jgi:chorismate mutase/prephenate dehydrogenase
MSDEPLEARPLPVLRALLDAVDRDILQLLARRMATVGEIAAHKRSHAIRIRDLVRERAVLSDRIRRAKELGLPAGIVESIYRLVLLASREHQASLRAEVPPDIEPRTVAIIGGEGAMGTMMGRMFADLGHAVISADLGTRPAPAEAAAMADVVVVSVPIRNTEEVIAEVGPHVRPDGLLMDLTSLKERPVEAMLDATEASVVGTHPLFGPGVHTLQGQRVVVCRGRGDAWFAWVRQTLEARGLVVTEADPDEHDRMMALVQVLNHFQTQVMGLALSRLGVPFADSLAFTSPAYLLESYVTARHFAQSPDLYGPIEMDNPRRKEVTDAFQAAAAELSEILESKDQARFDAVFQDVRSFFGDFTEEALEQSRFLIDRLIELSAGR